MKPRLTFEEHADMGQALASIRNELLHRHVQLARAYPQSGQLSVPAKKLDAAREAIDSARAALDNLMFQEHPQEGQTSTYYPQPED